MLECVANVSEGRDPNLLAALVTACGPGLLDLHADADHHRSVFTIAGPGTRDAETTARHLARAVAANVSLAGHEGVHPRFGALDVVPFVALGGSAAERHIATLAARAFARWWADTFAVPVFCYDDADAKGRDLPHARLHAFKGRTPDFGPAEPHPMLGATAVGARAPLVAVNCMLVTRDIEVARRIAATVRARNDGLPGVRALGFILETEQRAQVSMNLTDLPQTGIQEACLHVRELARAESTDVARVELVGLVPRAELDRCSDDFLAWSGLDTEVTIESRLARAARAAEA
ncbi:MAG: glutamate formiminotransferase [Acidimicrobiia bacterium]